ncbi:MAG: sigma-70 family RNA polymerase sigma factor [Proteobacteria bacterium]|nr:sigma-70 family RNA polymerase sigma factor [Pseudomonadota bacterium]MBU1716695.1 sigma-70 family RNA polymerase sigma factor [Pseudomonadota bacterium]
MNKTSLHQQLSALLQGTARGDDQAFQKLYELVNQRVYFYLYRILGCKETAEDVLVETFTVVWQSAGSFAGKSAVTTWIFGIARNLALNEMRRWKSHDQLDNHPDLAGVSRQEMEQTDRARVVGLALAEISPRHKEVLDLVFFHEMTYPEISELIEIPVGTVKTRIFHAKAALRQALAEMKVKRDDL